MDKILSWGKALGLSLLAIFAPIHQLLLSTGVMIMIDLVTGIMASRKRGEPITSAGIRRTLSKMLVYEVALCVAFIAEKYISDVIPFVKVVSGMVALVELTSVYENLNTLGGNNLLKGLIDKLGSQNQEPPK